MFYIFILSNKQHSSMLPSPLSPVMETIRVTRERTPFIPKCLMDEPTPPDGLPWKMIQNSFDLHTIVGPAQVDTVSQVLTNPCVNTSKPPEIFQLQTHT